MSSPVHVPDYFSTTNTFCPQCGAKLRKGFLQWLCPQCGWTTINDPIKGGGEAST